MGVSYDHFGEKFSSMEPLFGGLFGVSEINILSATCNIGLC